MSELSEETLRKIAKLLAGDYKKFHKGLRRTKHHKVFKGETPRSSFDKVMTLFMCCDKTNNTLDKMKVPHSESWPHLFCFGRDLVTKHYLEDSEVESLEKIKGVLGDRYIEESPLYEYFMEERAKSTV